MYARGSISVTSSGSSEYFSSVQATYRPTYPPPRITIFCGAIGMRFPSSAARRRPRLDRPTTACAVPGRPPSVIAPVRLRLGGCRGQPDVDQVEASDDGARTRREEAGLHGAEGDGDLRAQQRRVRDAVVGPEAARQVDRDDRRTT